VDAQPRLAGAVVAYDVNVGGSRPEVRFQLLDEDGAPSGTEEILSEGAMGATGASIAPLVSGFATAFRADTGSDRVLRLELFEVGEVGLDSVDLGEVDSLSDTRPIVRTSPDDRSVVVAWTDDARLLTALGSCE